jgi:hypothetical protein
MRRRENGARNSQRGLRLQPMRGSAPRPREDLRPSTRMRTFSASQHEQSEHRHPHLIACLRMRRLAGAARVGSETSSRKTKKIRRKYPRARAERVESLLWLDSYLRTYVERDVRTLHNVGDLDAFTQRTRSTQTTVCAWRRYSCRRAQVRRPSPFRSYSPAPGRTSAGTRRMRAGDKSDHGTP